MVSFKVGDQLIGKTRFFLIAGPCVLESESLALKIAEYMKEVCEKLHIPYIFKSSYDKANRTSIRSYRGPGLIQGLEMLSRVKRELEIPVLTDIHSVDEAGIAAEVVDVIQIPAFLCRQTDIVVSAARSGRPINIKKAQFLAPWDVKHVIDKALSVGNQKILITERGTLFGYNNLVVDMRSIPTMSAWGFPVVFDATHSVQLPGGQGSSSGGQRQFVSTLARAAIAAGADGLFIEVHEAPDKALCDGPNSLALDQVPELLEVLLDIYNTVRCGTKEAIN